MSFKFAREDVFILLSSMGISLPTTSKISDEDLNKRLAQALDAAQCLRTVIDTTPFIPTDHPLWPTDGIQNLVGATNKMSFKEMVASRLRLVAAGAPGQTTVPSCDKRDTFQEMRNAVMGIAQGLSDAHDFCLTEQTGELKSCGVYFRVSDVYCVKDTPVYILLYKEITRTERQSAPESLVKYIGRTGYLKLVTIQATEFEQSALLKLFHLNSKRLLPNFYPAKDNDKEANRELGLKTTFLLPLGAISMQDMGKLTDNIGCEVCGKTKISRCRQCLSVSYCGIECQKQDWPKHKSTCRSLKGGTWKTLTFEIPNALLINNRETYEDALARRGSPTTTTGVPPPDIHNGKSFLVKFQISLFHFKEKAHMVIYDRQRSFNGIWRRCGLGEQDLFDEAEMRMGTEPRMYRWAKRAGDFQLSVCFDRPPSQNPPW